MPCQSASRFNTSCTGTPWIISVLPLLACPCRRRQIGPSKGNVADGLRNSHGSAEATVVGTSPGTTSAALTCALLPWSEYNPSGFLLRIGSLSSSSCTRYASEPSSASKMAELSPFDPSAFTATTNGKSSFPYFVLFPLKERFTASAVRTGFQPPDDWAPRVGTPAWLRN